MSHLLARRGILAASRPSAAGPLVSDTFTRADGALGTTETGQTWLYSDAAYSVVSNQAASGAGSGYQMALVNAGQADVDLSFTFDPVTSDPNDCGAIARYIDLGNHLLLDFTYLSGRWLSRLFQKLGGGGYIGLSALVDPIVPLGSDSSAPFRVRLIVDGDSGSFYVTSQADLATWVQIGTFTGMDASLWTPTIHGMAMNNGAGVRFDSFAISAAP